MNSGIAEFTPIPGVNYAYDYVDFFREQAGKGDDTATEAYRWQCKNDLFFLMYFGLGKTFFHPHPSEPHAYRWASWWVDRIREVEEGPETNTLDLWFRGSGKSQIMTVSENIQDALSDPSEKIAIFANNGKLANAFLAEIKELLETRQILYRWFPDILWENPRRQASLWSLEKGLVLKRENPSNMCTFEAWGLVDNMPTGRHFTKGSYDDCVTDKTINTDDQIKKTSDAFKLSLNLYAAISRRRIAGTRYSYADLYGDLLSGDIERELAEKGVDVPPLEVRKHAMRTPSEGGYKYWFFTEEETIVKEVEQGTYIFSCQNLLDPINPEDQRFSPELVSYYTKLPEGHMPRFLLVDLSEWDDEKRAAQRGKAESAFVTVGVEYTDPWDIWYTLEFQHGRMNPDEIVDYLFESYGRHKWIWGGIEKASQYPSIKFELDKQMRIRGQRLPIKPLDHKNVKKDNRISRLQPRWERQGLLFSPDKSQQALIKQFTQFPFATLRDGIDAYAHGEEYIPTRKKKRRTGPRRSHLTGRNKRGGY